MSDVIKVFAEGETHCDHKLHFPQCTPIRSPPGDSRPGGVTVSIRRSREISVDEQKKKKVVKSDAAERTLDECFAEKQHSNFVYHDIRLSC